MDVDVSNMTFEIYKNLIRYAIQKCNIVSFFRRYGQNRKFHEKIRSVIFPERNLNINFSYEEIENIAKKYSDNIEIKKYCLSEILEFGPNSSFPIDFFYINSNLLFSIKYTLEWLYYDYNIERFIERNHSHFLKKIDSFFEERMLEQKHISDCRTLPLYGTEYIFCLDDTMYDELVSMKDSIYDWDFPKGIMDICFYKDDKCWLCSEAHEKVCWIECENREEYEYLKSIGIEFNSFFSTEIPITIDDLSKL